MKKLFFTSIALIILTTCNSQTKGKTHNYKSDSGFEKIYPMALRGEMVEVFKVLDTINNNLLSEKEKSIRENYFNRFKNESEKFDFNTKDLQIIEFVRQYQSYWKNVLLNKKTVKVADSLFESSMANFLLVHMKTKYTSIKEIQKNLYELSNQYLDDMGYFSNAFGRTGKLYDLFLWKEDEVKNYPIQLINDSVNVSVHFMKDFIATGWSHYTTFGKSYASGWATKEALFAVHNAYDRDTENFKVSYLTHEGQHFLDYINFPMLKQADLEYRAKLVELVKSQETTYHLIGKFMHNAKKEKNNAHAFANYCVIRDLSMLIFNDDYKSDYSKWTNTSKEIIKEKSLLLFKNHSLELNKLGNETVKELIDL